MVPRFWVKIWRDSSCGLSPFVLHLWIVFDKACGYDIHLPDHGDITCFLVWKLIWKSRMEMIWCIESYVFNRFCLHHDFISYKSVTNYLSILQSSIIRDANRICTLRYHGITCTDNLWLFGRRNEICRMDIERKNGVLAIVNIGEQWTQSQF